MAGTFTRGLFVDLFSAASKRLFAHSQSPNFMQARLLQEKDPRFGIIRRIGRNRKSLPILGHSPTLGYRTLAYKVAIQCLAAARVQAARLRRVLMRC